MGYNGPILSPCQYPCVEWWGVGSNLLTCMGNEMSVLTLSLTLSHEMSKLGKISLYPVGLLLAGLFCSCVEDRGVVNFKALEMEAREAITTKRFDKFTASLGDDAALRLSALMLSEVTFSSATWGLTQLTLRPGASVKSKWASSMMRPASEDAVYYSGIDEAVTALSMLYPEGLKDFVAASHDAPPGMQWSQARVAAARLFGLTCLYYKERVRQGQPAMNLDFHSIPGRTNPTALGRLNVD